MISLTLAEAAAAMGGTIVGLAPGEGPLFGANQVTSVVIDSRSASPGALFFALEGTASTATTLCARRWTAEPSLL